MNTPTWAKNKPSMKKMENALVAAGLPINPAEWTAEQSEKAAEVLNKLTK